MDKGGEKVERECNPFESASIFSKITFSWLGGIFKRGLHETIREEHVYETLKSHQSDRLTDNFSQLWNIERKREHPKLLNVIWKLYGWRVFGYGLLYTMLNTTTRVFQPLFLGKLVTYFAEGNDPKKKVEAYLDAIGIIICILSTNLVYHPFVLYVTQIGMKIRVTCCSLIYKKTLRITKSTLTNGIAGLTINLMSNDAAKFDSGINFVHDLYKGPLEFFVFGFFIYREISVAGLVGLGFILLFVPLQIWMGKKSGTFRLRTAEKTDIRVRVMNEIIQGIQVIKMYAWEKPFAKLVDKIRKNEMEHIKGTQFIRGALVVFTTISHYAIFFSLITYLYLGNTFTARKVFIVTTYFNYLYNSMLHMWPCALISIAEVLVSMKRIQAFLLMPEQKSQITFHMQNNLVDKFKQFDMEVPIITEKYMETREIRRVEHLGAADEKGIIMKNVTASYLGEKREIIRGISEIDLKITPEKLCMVIGTVGCGKSTLLDVILGELQVDDGYVTVNGVFSYASQNAWLFEGTVRNNILFTEKFDEARYNEVVRVCELEKDFQLLPSGDGTIVGERGISLSGGQKARINLARAIYRKADIYLLDDPLSALDTRVGKHIFENCVVEFLRGKVCVIATHQLQYLKDVEHIVLMNSGKIEAQGSYQSLMKTKSLFLSSGGSNEKDVEIDETDGNDELMGSNKSLVDPTNKVGDKFEEFQETGSISVDVYKSYFKTLQSSLTLIWVAITFIATQAVLSIVDNMISKWVNYEEEHPYIQSENSTMTDTMKYRNGHMIMYTSLILLLLFLTLLRSISFFKMCLTISRKLHDNLFRSIVQTSMTFFNRNPSGRILNRFSQDIGQIDTKLTVALVESITFVLQFLAIIILVAIVNPWFLLPTFILTLIIYGLRWVYMKTSRNIKRVEALTRSPIFSHANATLQGLSTIRAQKAQMILTREFNHHQNINTSAYFMFISTTRGFGLWLDLACVIYLAVITFGLLIFDNGILSGHVGLAISQVFNLAFSCQWGIRQTAELENQMTSVERIIEYTRLEKEEICDVANDVNGIDDGGDVVGSSGGGGSDYVGKIFHPPPEWPQCGTIRFENLNFKYSENEKYVLNNFNFSIEPNEKLGIVGRTGAGKSSIIQALFRLGLNDGIIEIDGIDINNISLNNLRRNISIIPQDSILFTGTLRYNLDPFSTRNDDEIWDALEQVELKPMVKKLADGINTSISDDGANFSMGQRQLICLARAILRRNKILILDEATANVDPETDSLIQKTIRTKFRDCTVITIAHRLHTIMDYDRVLVVENGCAVEIDTPYQLIQNGGSFKRMFDQIGSGFATYFTEILEQNFNDKKTL